MVPPHIYSSQKNDSMLSEQLENKMVNAIRFLTIDAIEEAKSGHAGTPMGMAEIAYVLWHYHLSHNPNNPLWENRDRFVLSNGHGSMLLYSLLHLTGYDLTINDLKKFRQLDSKTPGHPEVGITPGVDATTGPLGQGIGNAVGMALTEKLLAIEFNQKINGKIFDIVNHFTYVFMGDGCMMEGVSHEVCSLAGTLRLSKLIVIYDDNGISTDGKVDAWFADDTPKRFDAYGWHVIADVDGHDMQAIDCAITQAKIQAVQYDGRPTIICCKTIIGKGAKNMAGTPNVHGGALGDVEIAETRSALNWPYIKFKIPDDVIVAWNASAQGEKRQTKWQDLFSEYRIHFPVLAEEFERRMIPKLSNAYHEILPMIWQTVLQNRQNISTCEASQNALNLLAPVLPELFGGSADLTKSNFTKFKKSVCAERDQWGNYLSYGVREFGMATIMNGIGLHGGLLPYGGTFLTFSDYSRNAIRMAALMKQRIIHILTHDSIGLGENGPTHQSIEHLPSLRIIPGLHVWRPADGLETVVAWTCAIERFDGPSILALCQQSLPPLLNKTQQTDQIRCGAYVLAEESEFIAIIIATGSETHLALAAHQQLSAQGIPTRVVSMPCSNIFDNQSLSYQEELLPPHIPTIAVEAAHPDFWYKYVGRTGTVVGIACFGKSAPAEKLFHHFGITKNAIVDAVLKQLSKQISIH